MEGLDQDPASEGRRDIGGHDPADQGTRGRRSQVVFYRDDDIGTQSRFLVEGDRPGFIRSRKLEKMGMESQDTAELAFDECRIPADNLLGQEGGGFMMLMQKLQQERLCVAIMSQANAEKVLEDTIAYTHERKAFGRPISKFQNTQFSLAQCATEVEVGRAFLDKLVAESTTTQAPRASMRVTI